MQERHTIPSQPIQVTKEGLGNGATILLAMIITPKKYTLQETRRSHLEKMKLIFKSALVGNMLS